MDTATENLNYGWSLQPTSQTRRLKVILPQIYAAIAIFAANLSHEIFGYTIFVLSYSFDIEVHSLVAFDWIMCVGLLVGGIAAQIIGARVIVMLAGATAAIGWITLGWISPNAIVIWIIYIVAFMKGMIQAPSYVYVAEISQPNMRSALVAIICLSSYIGMTYLKVLVTVSTKITAIINVILALVGVVVMGFLPDSPYWLANRGRFFAVESSLAWFRGRTTVENVKLESKSIISNAQSNSTAYKSFRQGSFFLVGLFVGYAFLATVCVRIFYVSYYLDTQFELLRLGYEDSLNNISLATCILTVLISTLFVSLVAVIGKRIMFLISLFGAGLAMFVASIVGFLSSTISIDACYWLLQICALTVYFSLITGAASVPLMLNAELFPSRLRYLGAGFGLFFVHILVVIYNRFLYNYLYTSPGALLALALATIFAFFSLFFLFPRNENKSLVDIEKSSPTINDLRRKK